MSAVLAEVPLSPELVLVSPPEDASLARQLLADPEQTPWLSAAAPRARSSAAGVAGFYAFCLVNSLAPFALAALLLLQRG